MQNTSLSQRGDCLAIGLSFIEFVNIFVNKTPQNSSK